MMHVLSCLFNKFLFIYIQPSCFATKTIALKLSLNMFILIYSFGYPFQEFKNLPLVCQHLYKIILSLQRLIRRKQLVSGTGKYNLSPDILLCCHQKTLLALVLFNSVQCNRQKSVIIFVSERFSEMYAMTNKNRD